jgi:hypothetical protein
MLKRTTGFLLTIALVHCVAYAPKAYAVSAPIVISHVQPGVSGGATKEFVVLRNNSAEPVEVTNWCIKNKSNVLFACIIPPSSSLQAWIPPYTSTIIASQSYADSLPSGAKVSVLYSSVNQSSGALVGSSDTVALIDKEGLLVDSFAWTSPLSNGAVHVRSHSALDPLLLIDSDDKSDWKPELAPILPMDLLEWIEVADECAADCIVEEPTTLPTIRITEILPNPAGADTGKEFIELHNDGDTDIDLYGFIIQYGSTGEKQEKITKHIVLKSNSYYALTSADAPYVLPNTTGFVRLLTADLVLMYDAPAYENPKDDQAWASFDDSWRYTKLLTPGTENREYIEEAVLTIEVTTTPKPCAANQYRNPETNRCRAIATVAVQTACKAGQYRNPETGRCRTVATVTQPTPCKEGQERNVETNRCRNIRKLATVDYDILAAKPSTQANYGYIFLSVAAIVLAILSYAVWEWRAEIRKFLVRLRWRVLRR